MRSVELWLVLWAMANLIAFWWIYQLHQQAFLDYLGGQADGTTSTYKLFCGKRECRHWASSLLAR